MVKLLSKISRDLLNGLEAKADELVNMVWSYGKAVQIDPCLAKDVTCPMCGQAEGYIVRKGKDESYKAWSCSDRKCITVNSGHNPKFSNFPPRLSPTQQLVKPIFDKHDTNLPHGMEKASISQLTACDDMMFVVRDIMAGTYNNTFFYGPPGTGKTYLACAIINQWMESSSKPAIFMRWEGMVQEWLREYQEDITSNLGKRLSRIPLLVIDDICSKDVTDKFMSWFQVVTGERFDRGLPTICTGNFCPKEVGSKLSAPILSRLGLRPVNIHGMDRRRGQ